jgi:hypothetical protein
MPKTPLHPDEWVRCDAGGWRCPRCPFGGPRVTVGSFRLHYRKEHPKALPVRLRFEVKWAPVRLEAASRSQGP